jgi:hypothetical protein
VAPNVDFPRDSPLLISGIQWEMYVVYWWLCYTP